MSRFPDILPCITIKKMEAQPFEVRAMQGLDQGFGVKQYSAEYCVVDKKYKRKAIEIISYIKGFASIHGIRCLEFKELMGLYGDIIHELTQYITVTDSHIKIIAAMEEQGGVNVFQSFMDDNFLERWGVGEDKYGMKINLEKKKVISCGNDEKLYVKDEKPGVNDIVGRYIITINRREYDTIRQIFIGYNGQVTEFYFDITGKEILKRHFKISLSAVGEESIPSNYIESSTGESFYLNDIKRRCETYVIHDYVL
ncbi:hypothetical protein [Clostridium sp. Marseille-P299]|uniref:hypothetical protein n=1 Tax=Clostridium sp. Marseille-P299 TaxID=1805477 RepID=UPI00082DD68D|nr:hypothetical protein [Clostridium sp. Marseille-P299]